MKEKDEVKVILLHNLHSDYKNQWENSSSSLADSPQYTGFSLRCMAGVVTTLRIENKNCPKEFKASTRPTYADDERVIL